MKARIELGDEEMSKDVYSTVQIENKRRYGFTVVARDFSRPWGGFLVIDEETNQSFANRFSSGLDIQNLRIGEAESQNLDGQSKVAPVLAIIIYRRAEIWQVYRDVGVIQDNDDVEGAPDRSQ